MLKKLYNIIIADLVSRRMFKTSLTDIVQNISAKIRRGIAMCYHKGEVCI